MKIDDSLNGVPVIRNRAPDKGKDRRTRTTPGHEGHGDSVEITRTSARLSRLEEELDGIDAADTGKVDAIRQAISEGRFQVDEQAVADALVEGTMEQLRRQGRSKP